MVMELPAWVLKDRLNQRRWQSLKLSPESCWLGFLQAVPFGGMNTILLRTSNFSKHSITVFWTLLENLLLSTFWPQLATRCKAKYSSLCTGYRVRFTAVTWYSCSGLSKHQTHQLATHQRPQLPWRLDMSRLQKNQSPLIAMARQIGLRCRFSGHKIWGTERESGRSRIYKLLWYGFVG